jgi:hypothetical protein
MMIRAQILFDPDLFDQLNYSAQVQGVSKSFLVRKAVAALIGKKVKTGKKILQDMAKHSVSCPKAPRDLSTNEDYLYK